MRAVIWRCWWATLAAVPLSFLGGRYQGEQTLQHAPTVVGLLALAWWLATERIDNSSAACLLTFAWLHLIGARWIYSMVPYDGWAEWLTGSPLSTRFGWERNHYDRLVHFASGVLFTPPAIASLQPHRLPSRLTAGLAITMVMTIAAVYEIAEWGIAVTMSPRAAESYNGQQGDVWDPQKDMALALAGAMIVVMAKGLRFVTMIPPRR